MGGSHTRTPHPNTHTLTDDTREAEIEVDLEIQADTAELTRCLLWFRVLVQGLLLTVEGAGFTWVRAMHGCVRVCVAWMRTRIDRRRGRKRVRGCVCA